MNFLTELFSYKNKGNACCEWKFIDAKDSEYLENISDQKTSR